MGTQRRKGKIVSLHRCCWGKFKLKISPTQWVLAGSEELIGACTVWIYELVAVILCAWIPEEGSYVTWGC